MKKNKVKVITTNKVLVTTLETEAWQMLTHVIRDAGYINLFDEIVKNTKVKTKNE